MEICLEALRILIFMFILVTGMFAGSLFHYVALGLAGKHETNVKNAMPYVKRLERLMPFPKWVLQLSKRLN